MTTIRTVDGEAIARLYDMQLRNQAANYSNMGNGRNDSAAYLDRFFHELVNLSAPELFIEAGAFKAEASRRVKHDHPGCDVVAFEANRYNHDAMDTEFKFAALGIDYLNLAVSDQPGEVTFHLRTTVNGEPEDKVTGNSSLLTRTDPNIEYEEMRVRAVSLDSHFSAGMPKRTVMWIDVEGASGPLLQGADSVLTHTDVIMIEVEEYQHWAGQWLSLDVLTHLIGAGFVPLARDIEYENQFNIVFASAEFARRPDVLRASELHENFLIHHMRG